MWRSNSNSSCLQHLHSTVTPEHITNIISLLHIQNGLCLSSLCLLTWFVHLPTNLATSLIMWKIGFYESDHSLPLFYISLFFNFLCNAVTATVANPLAEAAGFYSYNFLFIQVSLLAYVVEACGVIFDITDMGQMIIKMMCVLFYWKLLSKVAIRLSSFLSP